MGEPFLREEEETYLVQLINRHHIILLSSKDTNWNRIDILQIGLNEERGVESNSDISLDWRIVVCEEKGLIISSSLR